MSKWIEYNDIVSAINSKQDVDGVTYEILSHALVDIELAPSIDIVRCKECIHRTKNHPDGAWCSVMARVLIGDDDGFCAWGESKGEE